MAGICLGSAALADEAPAQPSANTKLKWRARASAVERAKEQPESSAAPRVRAQRASAQEASAGISGRSSRAKTRDSVMQVSSTSDPAQDPFGDSGGAKKIDDRLKEPADEPTMPKDELFEGEPSPLPTPPDRSSEDAIPTPPSADEPLPQGEMSDGAGVPVLSCNDNKADCLRGIADLQARGIDTIQVRLLIDGTEGEDYPCECKLGREFAPVYAGRSFSPTTYHWKATGVCHKPLYFEDVQLERYGHSWNPVLQPFMSAAHFFVSVPLLPYNMGLTPPQECIYTLGYYRPGNCAPYVIEPIPFTWRAAISEAFGVTGFAFLLWP
jgi:hypothetical protein